jgi:hypothetical protein
MSKRKAEGGCSDGGAAVKKLCCNVQVSTEVPAAAAWYLALNRLALAAKNGGRLPCSSFNFLTYMGHFATTSSSLEFAKLFFGPGENIQITTNLLNKWMHTATGLTGVANLSKQWMKEEKNMIHPGSELWQGDDPKDVVAAEIAVEGPALVAVAGPALVGVAVADVDADLDDFVLDFVGDGGGDVAAAPHDAGGDVAAPAGGGAAAPAAAAAGPAGGGVAALVDDEFDSLLLMMYDGRN